MKAGDLVKAHNKAQTIGVVMCVEASRIQVLTEENGIFREENKE